MVIWVLFPFIVCISCGLSFHSYSLLFKFEGLKAQSSSCDALVLSNLNYVIVFLTHLEFISSMLWYSYLSSLSSYTSFYFKNNSDSLPYLAFVLWRVLSSWCIVSIHFQNFESIAHSVPLFFSNNSIKNLPSNSNLATDFHRYINWHERSLSELGVLVPQL
jgi:glycerol-3-phosphate acyltransferase PlsY